MTIADLNARSVLGRIKPSALPCAGTLRVAAKRSRVAAKRGYTFIEVVLVLGLLIALVGIFWPSIARLMEADKLSRGVEETRALLIGLRVRAMEEEATLELIFDIGAETYRVRSSSMTDDQNAQADNEGGQTNGATRGLDLGTRGGEFDSGDLAGLHRLDQGLHFERDSQFMTSSSSSPFATTDASATEQQNEQQLVARFRPDGSTEDFQILVVDREDMAVRVTMRGLTGVVSVERPQPYQGGRQ